MIIKKLNITAFGKLKNQEISLTDGLNVIYGKNESGKSTLAAFIEAMLYSYPPRSADREKYFPWDSSVPSGSLTLSHEKSEITISRRFGINSHSDKLVVTPPVDYTSLIPPTREAYRKSVYSAEDSAGYFGSCREIESKIANIMATGDENISASAALEKLDKLRRSIKAKRGSSGILNETDSRISMLEDELNQALSAADEKARLRDRILLLSAELSALKKELSRIESERSSTDCLPEISQIEAEIEKQKALLSSLPSPGVCPPADFSFGAKDMLLYIICTVFIIIIGLITFKPLIAASAIPPFSALIHFLIIRRRNLAEKKLFQSRTGCSSTSSYEEMLRKREEVIQSYNALLNKKAHFSQLLSRDATLSREQSALYKKILSVRDEISSLNHRQDQLSFRSPDSISEDLAYYRQKKSELTQQLEAIDLAAEAITYARRRISEDFTPQINLKATEYLNTVAPKSGRNVTLSKDFTLALTDPIPRDISSSSFGFRRQMYLCFRIALSDFLYGNSFPLIFDDPFTGSDDLRENALIDLLFRISEHRQVIIFTNRLPAHFNQLNCNWVDISPSNDV